MDEDLPIGQFARLCRLSVKQLRHYDSLGLLPAARIDLHSGYRYYRAEQARDAMLIALMRSLDVPLGTIKHVLDGQLEELKRHRDDLEADLRRKQAAIVTVEQVLREGLPRPKVSVITVPELRAEIARGQAADNTQIGKVTSACIQRLPDKRHMIGLFPVDFTIEPIAVAVAAVTEAGPEVLSGGTFAETTHIGPYDQIGLTAHGLLSWCAANGFSYASPIREVYLSDPATTIPVTQLMVPLEGK